MFKGINIESSAACNLKCIACPTTSYRRQAAKGYLKTEILDAILPLPAGLGGHDVDLTGWGEPLLNPHFPEILAEIPGATFTTNATLLDDRWAERIIKFRVGAMAFSIDAARPETYARLHGGGDGKAVWLNLKRMRRRRDEAGVKAPFLSAHFLLMRSNANELAEFVERAADAGMDEVVIKHVALFARPSQITEALFTGFFHNLEVDASLRDDAVSKAMELGRRLGIGVRKIGADRAVRASNCFGGALERPFVAWNGKVSPCCVLAHEVSRIDAKGEMVQGPQMIVGDIMADSLETIWNREEYLEHRKDIAEGRIPPACNHCLGLWSVTVEPVS